MSTNRSDNITSPRQIIGGILISCLVTAAAAVVVAVIIAILDMYLSGHNMEPPHWLAIREWLFRGSLTAVFFTTLFVALKVAPNRS